jgi:hypothetical protein
LGLVAILAAGLCVASGQAPKVLIVQQRDAVKEGVDPNVYVLDYLAQEMEASGILSPVVWSMTDPAFRTAALDGTLTGVKESPTLDEAQAASGRLRADYTIWIKATKSGGKAKGSIRLFRGKGEIWKDEQTLGITVGNEASDVDTGRSLARTWMLLISSKALKNLKSEPKIATPAISPGQQPPAVTLAVRTEKPTDSAKPEPVDNAPLKTEVAAMINSGRRTEAVLRLRDAVDQAPLDLERRSLLIETLSAQDPSLAAEEARRASILFPENADLRILAARAWMRAGKSDEARNDLNEAVARDPKGIRTRLLLAEMSLGENKPENALEHLDAAIKTQPTADALFERALCRALLGGAEGLEKDLDESKRLEPEPMPDTIQRRFDLAAAAMQAAMKQACDDQRSLLQRAMVRPKDTAVQEEKERLQRQARSRVAFMSRLTIPVANRAQFERRLLAARLLDQSLIDLQAFLDKGSEDSLTESRINLGEAVRNLSDAEGGKKNAPAA